MVRCKFRFTRMETQVASSPTPEGGWAPKKQYTLHFEPVGGKWNPQTNKYEGDDENTLFWMATPSGQFHFSTVNEEAAKFFEFGREYLVDFTPAPMPQPAAPANGG